MSGFVFPVGLVMIVLQGQELLTSNMMVCASNDVDLVLIISLVQTSLFLVSRSIFNLWLFTMTANGQTFPVAVLKRAVPWWSLPLNWFIVFWGNLAGSLFFAAVLARYSGLLAHEPYVEYMKHYAQCVPTS
jgi:formate/nitrite transporter FocA (FNT family)